MILVPLPGYVLWEMALAEFLLFGSAEEKRIFFLFIISKGIFFFHLKVTVDLVISTSLISNNRLSRSEILVPVFNFEV